MRSAYLPTLGILFMAIAFSSVRTHAQMPGFWQRPISLSLLAGDIGGPGSSDATSSLARLNAPFGIAVDVAGNVFVADTKNHTIRKITPAGVTSTFVGKSGSYGSADGTGSFARFNNPQGLAFDSSGVLYVADTNNDTIRKVTPAGVVTTLAGSAGLFGSTDATGSGARFWNPYSVAVDASGNVYVADWGNTVIRKITSAGVVTTFAGTAGAWGSTDATGSAARFNFPQGVAVDSVGNLYVADNNSHTVRKITPARVVTTLAGSAGAPGSTNGTGGAARFNAPRGITVDATGNVFVGEMGQQIRQITPAGVVTTLAGAPNLPGSTDATGAAARFQAPQALAIDSGGNIYVADSGNNDVRKVTSAGVVTTLAGAASVTGSTDATGASARFKYPMGLAVDTSGNVYVCDDNNNTVRKITSSGVVTTLAGTAGTTGSTDASGSAARFNAPEGTAVDSSGNVFIADANNHTIRKITAAGVVTTFAGTAGASGSTDATGAAARFYFPRSIAVDGSGNLYVADTGNHTIRKITPARVVTTVAGSSGVNGTADGTGSAARFNNPQGLAVDGSGNVYVADTNNSTIRKITPGAVVTTVAGLGGTFGTSDGTGAAARFNGPQNITVDGSGNMYVADNGNYTIRKITPAGVVSTIAGVAGLQGLILGPIPSTLGPPYGIFVDANKIYFSVLNGVVSFPIP